MTLQPGTYAILEADLTTVRRIDTYAIPTNVKDGRAKPVTMTPPPVINPATQKVVQNGWTVNTNDVTPVWQIVALTPAELEAIADATEKAEVKETRDEIAADIDASVIDQAQAQAYIDLVAPTNNQRDAEVKDAAKRYKASEQSYRRLARAVRSLLKST